MAQVTVTLNGRAYKLSCGDGEEARLEELAGHVRGKLEDLVARFGQAGNDRLLLMTALLIADELWDARAKAGEGQAVQAAKAADKPKADTSHKAAG